MNRVTRGKALAGSVSAGSITASTVTASGAVTAASVTASGAVAAASVTAGGNAVAAGEQQAHIADLTALTGGESPTEAEHNAAVTAVNGILASLREFGILAPVPEG